MAIKKRLLIWCDSPTVPTGFGNVCKNLFSDLNKTFDVAILGINEFGLRRYDATKYHIYPTDRADMLGFERLPLVLKDFNPDIILLFQDVFNIDYVFPIIRKWSVDVPVMFYFPIDGTPVNQAWKQVLQQGTKLITYTKWGVDAIKKAHPELKDTNIEHLYHGVDSNVFFLLPSGARQKLKEERGWDNKFLCLSINRFQPRKMLTLALRAHALFTKGYKECRCGNTYLAREERCDLNNCGPEDVMAIHDGHDDAFLYIHANAQERMMGPGKANSIQAHLLNVGFVSEDINKTVTCFAGNLYENPLPESMLNVLYNIADVNVSTTLGEGSLIEGTSVLTADGYKLIENVQEDDLVFNDKQEYVRVNKTLRKKFTGDTYSIRLYKFPEPLILSQDHHILTTEGYVRPDQLTIDNKIVFKKTKSPAAPPEQLDLAPYTTKHSVIDVDTIKGKSGKHHKRFIPINEETCKFMGLYVAEGSGSSGLQFSLHHDETDLHGIVTRFAVEYIQTVEKTYKTPEFVQSKKDRSGSIVIGVGALKAMFAELFGRGAHNKKFPLWILGLSAECRQAFLDGLIAGDGYTSKKKHVIRLRTVSKQLAYLTRDLMVSLNMIPSVTLQDNSLGHAGKGATIYSVDYTGLDYNEGLLSKGHFVKQYEVLDNEIILNIKSIDKIVSNKYSYDLEVPQGESYGIGQCMVHNCGLSLIEAAAAGTTSIAPKQSAIPEMIGDTGHQVQNAIHINIAMDNGHLRPVISMKHYLIALETEYQKWIANGRKKVVNQAAIERTKELFVWDDIRAKMEGWIKECSK